MRVCQFRHFGYLSSMSRFDVAIEIVIKVANHFASILANRVLRIPADTAAMSYQSFKRPARCQLPPACLTLSLETPTRRKRAHPNI